MMQQSSISHRSLPMAILHIRYEIQSEIIYTFIRDDGAVYISNVLGNNFFLLHLENEKQRRGISTDRRLVSPSTKAIKAGWRPVRRRSRSAMVIHGRHRSLYHVPRKYIQRSSVPPCVRNNDARADARA